MGAVCFVATADSKGRLEVPKKFKSWFDEPVTMQFDGSTGALLVTKDFEGEELDGRRRISLGTFKNTLVEVREVDGALQIKQKIGRY
jgi:DNA-binding transcriptional regulator/RsmH inhibitor MraZ